MTVLIFYSKLFLVESTTGGWRPIMSLLLLNTCVAFSKFRVETVMSILDSIQRQD